MPQQPALLALDPGGGQVELAVDQGVTARRSVGEMDGDLAQAHPAKRTGVLVGGSHTSFLIVFTYVNGHGGRSHVCGQPCPDLHGRFNNQDLHLPCLSAVTQQHLPRGVTVPHALSTVQSARAHFGRRRRGRPARRRND